MTDTIDTRARLEEFFRRRSDDPDSVKVVDYQLITGGYSRQMSRAWIEDGGQTARLHHPPGSAARTGDHRHRPRHRVGGALDAPRVGKDPDAGAALVRSDRRGARQPRHRHRDVRRRGARQRRPQVRPERAAEVRAAAGRDRWRAGRVPAGGRAGVPRGAGVVGRVHRLAHPVLDRCRTAPHRPRPVHAADRRLPQGQPSTAGAAGTRPRRLPGRQRVARHRWHGRARGLGAGAHRRPSRGSRLVHDGQRHAAA